MSISKIKICLVNPKLEGPYPPLGLAYIASYLKKFGKSDYDIKLVDGNHSKDIVDEIINFNPRIVAFTSLSPQIKQTIELSKVIRDKCPQAFQVIGGLHVSADPEQTLKRGSFDIAVLGEGEQTFKEIVEKLIEGFSLREIEGIAFLDNELFVKNNPRKEIENLDEIPHPDRSLFDMEKYLSHFLIIRGLLGDRITTIHTSRGCPYDCVFCSCNIAFKKTRYYSVDYVLSEIKELIEKYKIKSLFFTDDTFIVNKIRVRQLCEALIEAGINKEIKWEVQGRANLVGWQELDLLKLMKEAGCVQIDYGFETGSDRILKFLKKRNVSIEFNQRAIEVTKAAGLKVMGTFMLGIPGETQDDVELTKYFILKNKEEIDNFQTFIATPFPGSELFEICRQKKLIDKDYFYVISQEEFNKNGTIYSDSVSFEKVVSTQKLLNRLAVGRIKLKDKILWLIANFLKHPANTLSKVYYSFVR